MSGCVVFAFLFGVFIDTPPPPTQPLLQHMSLLQTKPMHLRVTLSDCRKAWHSDHECVKLCQDASDPLFRSTILLILCYTFYVLLLHCLVDVVMSMNSSAVARATGDGEPSRAHRGLLGASSRRERRLAAQQLQQLYHTRTDSAAEVCVEHGILQLLLAPKQVPAVAELPQNLQC